MPNLNTRIAAFIEVLIPITACNLECHYCYIIQRHQRAMEAPKFHATPSEIGYALRPERFGGRLYVSLCGAGETMLTKELPEIVKSILEYGNYINITTNGTIRKSFYKIAEITPPNC